jgi:hypothetical protein
VGGGGGECGEWPQRRIRGTISGLPFKFSSLESDSRPEIKSLETCGTGTSYAHYKDDSYSAALTETKTLIILHINHPVLFGRVLKAKFANLKLQQHENFCSHIALFFSFSETVTLALRTFSFIFLLRRDAFMLNDLAKPETFILLIL